jgi:uncharacterized membrane-anchored protein
MTVKRIFIGLGIAVIFQTAILVQMVWSQITLLNSPTETVLQTRAVDPRDIFRGDYVILDYTISTFADGAVPIDKDLKPGKDVFVVLDTSRRFATATRVLATYPTSLAQDEAVIRGTVNWMNEDVRQTTDGDCGDCTVLSVSYPIDSYFVPEGTGVELEERRDANELGVIVALNDEGDVAIKGLMVNNVRVYDTPLF